MAYCGSFPGMCGHQPDCADQLCEGHPLNYISREGGTKITDNGPEPLFLLCKQCRSTGHETCRIPTACVSPESPEVEKRASVWDWLASFFARKHENE